MKKTWFEIKRWTDFLPSERVLLKILISNRLDLSEKISKELKFDTKDIESFGDYYMDFYHPLMGVFGDYDAKYAEGFVDYLYFKGFLKDKKVNSLSSVVINFLKALATVFSVDFESLKSKFYEKLTKALSDYFKVPEGYVVVDPIDPLDYLSIVNSEDYIGLFGDLNSCFRNDTSNYYVWRFLDRNGGKVITVKVFKNEKGYKLYNDKGDTSLLVGAGRFLTYKVKLEGSVLNGEGFVAHNVYQNGIPFTPYFWFLVLKALFKQNGKPYIIGFKEISYPLFLKLGRNYLYVNKNTNGVNFVGFFITFDEKLRNLITFNRYSYTNRLFTNFDIEEYCPTCGESVRSLHITETLAYPDYAPHEAVFGDTLVGCYYCFAKNLRKYLNELHEKGLRDFDAYIAYRDYTGSNYFDDYYGIEYEEEYEND